MEKIALNTESVGGLSERKQVGSTQYSAIYSPLMIFYQLMQIPCIFIHLSDIIADA